MTFSARMAGLAAFLPPHLVRALARGGDDEVPRAVRLQAALLFSDISGFTALTERLQSRGREGAEEIVRIVHGAFAPAIAILDRHGGSVVTFGGDALFVLFDGPGRAARALRAAHEIRAHFESRGPVATTTGPVTLGLAQAVHHGEVRALYLGRADRRVHVVGGRAVAKLALLEKTATAGVIVASEAASREARRDGRPRPRPPAAPPPPERLARYVAPHVRDLDPRFEGEFRHVAILFLETRGQGVRALQSFVLRLLDVLDRHGGILVSPDLCADGMRWLCAFGAPSAHEDDPDRAARAAHELLASCPRGIALRGGIHAGTAAFIAVGTATRRSVEVMGDVTNTAARTMAAAPWGEVQLTEATRRMLRGVATAPRGSRAVKGKAAPLVLHAVQSASAAPRQLRMMAPMVGRDAEVAAIVAALEEASAGRGGAIAVGGEAGLGKSRLKFEVARVAREMGLPVHEGWAVEIGGSYRAIGELLRSTLDIASVADKETTRTRLFEAAARFGLPALDRDHLAELLDAPHADPRIGKLPSRDRQLNTMIAVSALFHAVSREQPRLLVLEDMHWADAATTEAAARLAAGAADAGYLLLLLHRPGYRPPAAARALVLRELPADLVEELVAASLGTAPPSIVLGVAERAGGNPFYVEELLRYLLEQDILSLGEHGYEVTRAIRPDEIPASVEAVIAARLDRLTRAERVVAQHGAVVGRAFLLELIERLPEVAPLARDGLEGLCARSLVFEHAREPHTEYLFKHALTRDVVYGSILASTRRRIHRDVADAIEAAFAAELEAFQPVLGHHREMAAQLPEARHAYRASALRAVRKHALEDAEKLLRAYLAITPGSDADSAGVRSMLGVEVLSRGGRHREAEEMLSRVREEAHALGDRSLEAHTLRHLAEVAHATGRREKARELWERELAIYRDIGDRKRETEALASIAAHWSHDAPIEETVARVEEVLAIGRATGHAGVERALLGTLANIRRIQGLLPEALGLYRQVLEMARRDGDAYIESFALVSLGGLHMDRGDLPTARPYFEQALAVARATGERRMEVSTLVNLSEQSLLEGRLEDARRQCDESLALARLIGNDRLAGVVLQLMGMVGLLRGDAAAEELVGRGEQLLRGGDRIWHGKTLCTMGHILLAHGSSATQRLDEARAIAADMAISDAGDLGSHVARLARAQAAWEAGEQLVAGHLVEDLTEGMVGWLRQQRPGALPPPPGRAGRTRTSTS